MEISFVILKVVSNMKGYRDEWKKHKHTVPTNCDYIKKKE